MTRPPGRAAPVGSGALSLAVAGFQLVKLAGLVTNLIQFPRLRRDRGHAIRVHRHHATSPDRTGVSLLVPARDEATRLVRTLPTLLDQPVSEILVLDDDSTDDTAAVARRCGAGDPRVHVLTGRPLPPGWTGKTWACHQLAEVARGDLLIFCDADVTLAPGAVDAILDEMAAQRAELFSVFPRQKTDRVGERLLVPLIDDVLLSFLPHALLRLPIPAAATANGQLLATWVESYRALGGHAGVAERIVEDVALARRARAHGMRLGLALGGDLVSARMYQGYGESVRGFGKSLRAAHGGSRWALVATAAWHLLAYAAPLVCWRRGRCWRLALWSALLHRALLNLVTGRGSLFEILLVPGTPVAALPAYLVAWRDTAAWRGREYPATGAAS